MHCPRCQHENRPQAKFCEECASPLNEASPTTRSDADPKSEVESLRQALTEALEQQTATAEILQTRNRSLRKPRAAGGDERDSSRHLQLADRRPARVRGGAESAARLCDAFDATIFRVEGDRSASSLTRARSSRTSRRRDSL